MKQHRVLLILIASFTIVGVFFALNNTFAWLSFFRIGSGQKFGAGDITIAFTPSYATYQAGSAYGAGKYTYLPGDDLCVKPAQEDIDENTYRYLGFNLGMTYKTDGACELRFSVEYSCAYPTTDKMPAYDLDFAGYTAAEQSGRDLSLISVKFNGDFYPGVEGGKTYWYYKPGGNPVLPKSETGTTISNMFTKFILSGPNIVNETGQIKIIITANMRQSGDTINWTNYWESSFDITVP